MDAYTRGLRQWTLLRCVGVVLAVWFALVAVFTVQNAREGNESEREWRESLDQMRAGKYESPKPYWRDQP